MFKWDFFIIFVINNNTMSKERKMRTTHNTSEDLLKKAKEQMERLKNTGKEYNPAPKESKDGEKKIQ